MRPANGSATVLKTNAATLASVSIGEPFLRRARDALDEQVEQRVRAEVLRRDAARDRIDLVARDGVLQRGRDVRRRRSPRRRGSAPSAPRRSRRPRRAASCGTPRPWPAMLVRDRRPGRPRARRPDPGRRSCAAGRRRRSARARRRSAAGSRRSGRESCSCSAAEHAEEVGALAVEHVHEDDARELELLRAVPDARRCSPRRPSRRRRRRARPRRRAARRSCRPGSPSRPACRSG